MQTSVKYFLIERREVKLRLSSVSLEKIRSFGLKNFQIWNISRLLTEGLTKHYQARLRFSE